MKARGLVAVMLGCMMGGQAMGQAATATAAAPSPLPTPSLSGPLQWLPPAVFDAGPLGKLEANGIVSGYGLYQDDHVPGDNTGQATLSNGLLFLQKADGPVQYFIQTGAYTIPELGVPFLSAADTVKDFFGPVPVAFLKLPVGKTTSFQIGSLPALVGPESTFTFQNMNVERGLLWNQENAVNRGIQVNQTLGKYFTASLSWNDGYYSNRYSWVSGALTFTKGVHSLALEAMGNAGSTKFRTMATPVQNNSSVYALVYTYSKGNWMVQPYYQFSDVPTDARVGVTQGATTNGGALLLSYAFKHGFSLPARVESIKTSGSSANGAVNLLFGPGSDGTSVTLTPTWQKGAFFARGDLAWVHAGSYSQGDAFGTQGEAPNQLRAVVEIGILFGSNIARK
ncbi:MAG: outer membrane beta-barrel protein [Acidobacteriaceae bacterium]